MPQGRAKYELAPGPRIVRATLVVTLFVCFMIGYLEAVSYLLRKSAALRELSSENTPVFKNFAPGLSYIGFIFPLIVALFAFILLLRISHIRRDRIPQSFVSNKFWIISLLLSVIVWYFSPGFASGGHTDFPLAIVSCFLVGWKWNNKSPRRSFLASTVVGFGIGLVSDLQSQTYFVGIFGGWGFQDGDLLGTLILPLAALGAAAIAKIIYGSTDEEGPPSHLLPEEKSISTDEKKVVKARASTEKK